MKFGGSNIDSVRFGSNAVSAVYFGTTQVWSAVQCVYGCTNPCATNYDNNATCDDGSCTNDPPVTITNNGCIGCATASISAYDGCGGNLYDGEIFDSNCDYLCCPPYTGIDTGSYCDGNVTVLVGDDGNCGTTIVGYDSSPCSPCAYFGCMDAAALNYDSAATCDNGSCAYPEPDAVPNFYVTSSNFLENGVADRLDLTWSEPNSVGPLIGYDLEYSLDLSLWAPVAGAISSPLSLTLGDPGGVVYYRIRAKTASNAGPWEVAYNTLPKGGCTDSNAVNYDYAATYDNGTCL